jgi:hypothetical protein
MPVHKLDHIDQDIAQLARQAFGSRRT